MLQTSTSYNSVVLPFYNSCGITETFLGTGRFILSRRLFIHPKARGKIVLVTGYNESYFKYAETISDLYQMGYSIYCYDHRGQGFSQRYPEQNKKGYVDHFSYYLADLKVFFDYATVHAQKDLPCFILAHSMGGAISVLTLSQKNLVPSGLILCSPMFQIRLTSLLDLEKPLLIIFKLICSLGFEKNYIWGEQNNSLYPSFINNNVTHSELRYSFWRENVVNREEFQLIGPTFGWVKEAVQASRLARRSRLNSSIPALLLQAEKDSVVENKGQDLFSEVNKHCHKYIVQNAFHEILMELDPVRNKALEQIKTFLASAGEHFWRTA